TPAASNTVADHITVLEQAIAQIPAAYGRKIIFRADGAGATKDLLAWIKTEAAVHGYPLALRCRVRRHRNGPRRDHRSAG
ncbi:hypothetical protein AAH979_42845, partial [Plantactinospora sp. ZYX-F-223]